MGKSKIAAPRPAPRLIPALVNEDPAVLARESTSHADAVARLEQQAGSALRQVGELTGRYLGQVILTGSGRFTPLPGACVHRVRGIGGGGAGGGALSSAGGVGAGAGGSSGVMFDLIIGSPGVAATGGPYVCGAGGVGSTGAGAAGGDSTLTINGTLLTAKGGAGGSQGLSTTGNGFSGTNAPAAGTTSTGLVTYGSGEDGMVMGGAIWISGSGGGSPLGAGGQEVGGGTNGLPGASYGGGGSGAAAQSNVNRPGGNGGAACFILDAYT